ncbi:MAG TPA: DUF4160 domain-containing protein [Bacteroidota bacterium]|nr:DUF4160 domain-containing protein [Bacteroidota bacterium]
MPRICEFFGIIITMYYNDHSPPHFHARYSGNEATILIETLEVYEGSLPRRALALVGEWAEQHRKELLIDWDLARKGKKLKTIRPLD